MCGCLGASGRLSRGLDRSMAALWWSRFGAIPTLSRRKPVKRSGRGLRNVMVDTGKIADLLSVVAAASSEGFGKM